MRFAKLNRFWINEKSNEKVVFVFSDGFQCLRVPVLKVLEGSMQMFTRNTILSKPNFARTTQKLLKRCVVFFAPNHITKFQCKELISLFLYEIPANQKLQKNAEKAIEKEVRTEKVICPLGYRNINFLGKNLKELTLYFEFIIYSDEMSLQKRIWKTFSIGQIIMTFYWSEILIVFYCTTGEPFWLLSLVNCFSHQQFFLKSLTQFLLYHCQHL